MTPGRKHRRRWAIWYGSLRLRGKAERRAARRDLRAGREPEPRYTTGKLWED
jgi:hypothetical protein